MLTDCSVIPFHSIEKGGPFAARATVVEEEVGAVFVGRCLPWSGPMIVWHDVA